MRRAATILGSLAIAGSLALGLSGSAWAAEGTLVVSGKTYNDPREGCYTGLFWPLSVNNGTDTTVLVFDDNQCQGNFVGTVEPGGDSVFEFGGSVLVTQ